MRISTEIQSAARRIGERRALELIAKAGFDAFDFSMGLMTAYNGDTNTVTAAEHPLGSANYAAFAKEIAHIGRELGLTCNQSHAPYPAYAHGMMPYFRRAIECTAIAGGQVCVIHPDNYKSAEENAEMYLELLPFAKECGVRIATENMWNWDEERDEALPAACSHHSDFLRHIELVNDPYFVACVDVGHAEMRGLSTSAVDMIRTLGHHVAALHLHDNDRHYDNHAVPFSRDLDFDAIVRALADVGYGGDITLEANRHLAAYSDEALGDGLMEMAAAARRLAEMLTAARG